MAAIAEAFGAPKARSELSAAVAEKLTADQKSAFAADLAKALRQILDQRDLLELAGKVVATHPGVTLDDVLSRSRRAPVSAARSHLAAELYDALGSFPAVGRCLGIDHTSALVARRRWLERSAASRPQDNETQQDWDEVLP